MFFLETAPTRHAIALSEVGCVPIDKNTASTYEKNGAIALANATAINDLVSKLYNPSFPYRTIVCDNYYAVADHDADGIGVYWGAFGGGCWVTPGKYSDFRWDTSPAASNLFPRSGGGLVWRGDDGGILFEFHGIHAYLDLCLLGTYFNTTTGVQDQIDNDCAEWLLKCQNIIDPPQDPRGLKTVFDLMFPIGRNGVTFKEATGTSHCDNAIVNNLYPFYLSGTLYEIDETQSIQHLILKVDNSGYPMDKMFSMLRGGVLHVVEAYCPNGTLLHMGPSGASGLSTSAADAKFDSVQLDSNFDAGGVTLIDCNSGSSNSRVRMSVNTTHIYPYPNTQLVRRLEPITEDNSTQPDIQVDFRNIDFVEQCAYPSRSVRGANFDATEFYPAPTITNTKLWFRASDQTDWVKGTPDGLRWNSGDIVASAEDLSNTQPTLTASGNGGPTFRRDGTNWRPTVDFYGSGAASHPLVVTAPVALDDNPSSVFMACVYTERQASLGNDSYIFGCTNTNGGGGILLYRKIGGKISFRVGTTSVDTVANIEAGRPYLIVANWSGSAIDLWVEGVKAEGSGSTLTTVTGHLCVGGLQTAATPTYGPCRGRISELIVATTSLNIDPVDSGAGNAPDLASWNSSAAALVRYLRSQYGVW